MKKSSYRINEYIRQLPEGSIFEVSAVFRENFEGESEAAFYKTIERATKEKRLLHIGRGLYYKPKQGVFGIVPPQDEEVAQYYMKDGHGIYVGYRLYNQKGISTQISKTIEVLSDSLSGEQKSVQNVKVKKINVALTPDTIPVIETLEILQNYNRIENLNNRGLTEYIREFASSYSDNAAHEVIQNRKYKKSTVAFLKACLDYLKVPNTLGVYLSKLSVYAFPNVEDLYEAA